MQTIRNVIRRVVKQRGKRQPVPPQAGIPARTQIRAGRLNDDGIDIV